MTQLYTHSLRIALTTLALCFSLSLFAQLEGTMPFMQSVGQITNYNPAFKPTYNFSFGLPANFFAQYYSNNITWKSSVIENGNTNTADGNKLVSNLQRKNYIGLNLQWDPLHMVVKLNSKFHLTLHAGVTGYGRLFVPKDLMVLALTGNNSLVNETSSLAPKGEFLSYIDLGVGGGYAVNKKLTVGGRIKLLRGIANATTKSITANMTTRVDQISLNASADVRTSGLYEMVNNGYNNLSTVEMVKKVWSNSGKNKGLALDVGATYQLTDKLMVGASMLDLGFIKWTNDIYQYRVDADSARFTYKGLDIDKALNDRDNYIDSLSNAWSRRAKLYEGRGNSYSTFLPTKFYFTGSYQLPRRTTANAALMVERFKGRLMKGFSASLHKEFGRWIGASISYTAMNNAYNNLGFGLSINASPFQWYIVGDNTLRGGLNAATDNIAPYVKNLKNFNVRVGMNLIVKWGDKHAKKTKEKKDDAEAREIEERIAKNRIRYTNFSNCPSFYTFESVHAKNKKLKKKRRG